MSTTSDAILRAEQIQERLLNHLPAQLRDWSEKFSLPQRGGLLSGPRGVGKTTCMLSRVEQNTCFIFPQTTPY